MFFWPSAWRGKEGEGKACSSHGGLSPFGMESFQLLLYWPPAWQEQGEKGLLFEGNLSSCLFRGRNRLDLCGCFYAFVSSNFKVKLLWAVQMALNFCAKRKR